MQLMVFDLSVERTNEGAFAVVSVITEDKQIIPHSKKRITFDQAGYILAMLENNSPEVEEIIMDLVAGEVE